MKFLLCLLLLTARLFADGGFIPSPRTGSLTPVEIPGQTAILAHKDGEETLTVWNTVKSDNSELAWVLPLPAAPSVIQQTDPRPIRALQIATAPIVDLADFRPVWGIVVFFSYFSLLALLWKPDYLPVRLALYVPIILMFALGGYGGYGTQVGGSGAPLEEVKVLAEQMTGNYETTVIKGTSAEAVNEWLKAREFPALAGDQLEAVREYIAKGWVFLCAKLPPTSSGITAAHPLTVRFPSEKPVYPMRLTRSAGTVRVDLFLFADSENYGEVSSRMTRMVGGNKLGSGVPRVQLEMDAARELPPAADALKDDALLQAMEETRFSGHFTATFGPDSDWSDVVFRIGVDHPPPPRYATRGALFSGALPLGALIAGVALLIFVAAVKERSAAEKPPLKHWKVILCTIVLLPPAAGAVRAFFPHWFSSEEIRIVDSSAVTKEGSTRNDARALIREWVEAAAPGGGSGTAGR